MVVPINVTCITRGICKCEIIKDNAAVGGGKMDYAD